MVASGDRHQQCIVCQERKRLPRWQASRPAPVNAMLRAVSLLVPGTEVARRRNELHSVQGYVYASTSPPRAPQLAMQQNPPLGRWMRMLSLPPWKAHDVVRQGPWPRSTRPWS